MARFKQIPQNFLFRKLIGFWGNMVRNYRNDCRDDDFFDVVSNCFEYVKIVESDTGIDRTRNYNLLVYEGALQITNRVICSEELRVNGEELRERIEKVYDGVATGAAVTASLLQPATVRYCGALGERAHYGPGSVRHGSGGVQASGLGRL